MEKTVKEEKGRGESSVSLSKHTLCYGLLASVLEPYKQLQRDQSMLADAFITRRRCGQLEG